MFKLLSAAIMLMVAPAMAEDFASFSVDNAYIHPPIGAAKIAVGFMTIHNPYAEDYKLMSVQSPAFGHVEMHTHIQENDIMRMRQIDAIDLPAGQNADLKPGGLHLMMFDAKAPLAAGDNIVLTLMVKSANDSENLEIDVPVKARAKAASAHSHSHGK